ncbi:hypothetical protein [Fundicoccus ignavus]|uniref:Uncharacterized protein n=1 Tax=Fundicoccus ignavus TaxID=2664442 RepID=A0A844BY15_9LACT|nr:hypothetical protein [Fundicoccus ignavus]MRJ46918.1 hypothetical protein [Fundicoccus ignavus]
MLIDEATYINENFYVRRYRENSTMTDKSEKQQIYSFNSYVEILKEYRKILGDGELGINQKNFIRYRINDVYFSLINIGKNTGKDIKKISSIEEIKIYFSKIYRYVFKIKKIMVIFKRKLL